MLGAPRSRPRARSRWRKTAVARAFSSGCAQASRRTRAPAQPCRRQRTSMQNTVKIGERELSVKRQDEPGGLGLLKRVTLASLKLKDGGVDDYPDNAADLIACYVGHN